jgi:hypothetical protein
MGEFLQLSDTTIYNYITNEEVEMTEEIMFNSEEPCKTRNTIVICELYNRSIHGIPSINSNVEYHYLVIERYKVLNIDYIEDCTEFMNMNYNILPNKRHNIFRNYKNIVSQTDYIKPQIAECIYLPNHECVAILKTFWIKIIQRKWKKICKEREKIIKLRSKMGSLRYREVNGDWPEYCNTYPSLKGMLQLPCT